MKQVVFSLRVLVESLRRKRCEALLRKGYARVRERDFDSALEIAAKLESQRFSGAFEIAALAHAGKGDLDAAVAVLRRGVEVVGLIRFDGQCDYAACLSR